MLLLGVPFAILRKLSPPLLHHGLLPRHRVSGRRTGAIIQNSELVLHPGSAIVANSPTEASGRYSLAIEHIADIYEPPKIPKANQKHFLTNVNSKTLGRH